MSAPLVISKRAAVPLSAPAALALGSQVEAHTILKVLAEGRHGFVYLTRHAVHGTTCVLKEFMPRLHAMRLADSSVSPCDAGDAIAMSVARIEFMQEATTLAGIDQPGLARVLGLLEANRTLYSVMPLYDGVTLQQLCRQRGGAPSLAWLAGIVDDLLRALETLHAHGRAHGRVQPNQVLVSAAQRATLLGFGSVARELDDPPADPWRAPEGSGAHRHLRPEPAGDLYALAATTWFAATGVVPQTTAEGRAMPLPGAREVLAALGDRPGDPPHLRRGLIRALDAGMAAAVGSRPQTVAEFRRLLQGESSSQVLPATMAPRWVGAEIAAPGHDGPLQSPQTASPQPADVATAEAEGVEPTVQVIAALATVGLAEAAPAATTLHAVIEPVDAANVAVAPAEAELSTAEPIATLRVVSALEELAPGMDAPTEAVLVPSARVDALRGGAAAVVPPGVVSVLVAAAPLQGATDAAELRAAVPVAMPQVAAVLRQALPLAAVPSETLPVPVATADAGLAAAAPVAGADVAAAFTQLAPFEPAPAPALPAASAATETPAPADVEVDGAATAVAAQTPFVVTEAAPGDAKGIETAHPGTAPAEDARARVAGVVTVPASTAFIVFAPDQAVPPPSGIARHAVLEESPATMLPAPGVDSPRRGRWRGAVLVAAAAVLAAGSIHWWTPTSEPAQSPVASRQAPGVAMAVVPRVQTPVAPQFSGEAPVAPALSSSDLAMTAPADPAMAAQANAGAEAPAAVIAAVPAATPHTTTLRSTAPRAAPPGAPAVPSARGANTSRKPGLRQSPVAVCGKAAKFSSCMRQLCAKPGYRAHAQCIQFRRKA